MTKSNKKTGTQFRNLLVVSILLMFTNILIAESNIEKIKLLLKQGKYENAESIIKETIEYNLNNPEILFYRGIIQTNLGKTNQAIDTFRDLTERFPELPEPFNNLAVLYAEKVNLD